MTNKTAEGENENIRIPMMNVSNSDDGKGKGIMGNKMLIWHCFWFGLAAVYLVVSIVYTSMKSLTEKQFNSIKFIIVPGLLIPTITEIILLIVNKSDEDINKDEEEDDGYVKPDFFSGWRFMLINVAAGASMLIISLHLNKEKYSNDGKGFYTVWFILVSIGNMIRCAYSEIKRWRMRKWAKWIVYVYVVIDIILILMSFVFHFWVLINLIKEQTQQKS